MAKTKSTPSFDRLERPAGILCLVVVMMLFVAALVGDVGRGTVSSGGGTAGVLFVIALIAGLVWMAARHKP